MITDAQTNYLYLADKLPKKHPEFYKRFKSVLAECKIVFDLLPYTNDIWAVDFMPVQVSEDHFVQFVYNPDYLRDAIKWRATITDPGPICEHLNIVPVKSDILVDGGNVVKSRNTVIMCDKVFRENPNYSEKALIKALKELLEVEKLFFVPQDMNDFTGHADGMVRFLNEDTVLINDLSGEKPEFQSAFRMSLHNAGLEYIEIPYKPDLTSKISAKGLYINYLEMDKVIILPQFGSPEDEVAAKQFEELFKGYTIRGIDCNEIAAEGGVLNCISWNIWKFLRNRERFFTTSMDGITIVKANSKRQ